MTAIFISSDVGKDRLRRMYSTRKRKFTPRVYFLVSDILKKAADSKAVSSG